MPELRQEVPTAAMTDKPTPWTIHVLVPVAQAIMTGFVAGILTAAAALIWRWPWQIPVGAFAVVLAVAWLWRLGVADSLLYAAEVVINKDLTDDDHIGRPTEPPIVFQPDQARATAGRLAERYTAEEWSTKLIELVKAAHVVGTSEAALGIPPSPSERAEHCKQRDALIELGIARWKNPDRPKAGWELVVKVHDAAALIRKHYGVGR